MTRALAILSGLLFAASFPKFGHPAIAWVALAPLLVAVAIGRHGRGTHSPFWLGWLTGVVYFGGTVYWVAEVMRQHGNLPMPVAVGIAGLMVAYLAIYPACFAALMGRFIRRYGLVSVWTAPVVWTAIEWVRSELGGFSWVQLGVSQATVLPIVQAASVAGVPGLSFTLALVSTAAAELALSRQRGAVLRAAFVAVCVAGVATAGALRVSAGALVATEPLRVGLVQPNVAQEQKYDDRFRAGIMSTYLRLSQATIDQGAELVLWPEAATPFYFDAESAAAQPVRDLARTSGRPFIVGTDEYEPPRAGGGDERFYNSAVYVGTDGQSHGSYRKMHLVPFGEYVPFQRLLFFVGPLVEAVSNFSAGTEPVVFAVGRAKISVAICYESVYPNISRQFVERGSQLLTTITNDAWFGGSSAPYQHFQQGAIRAVEQGRYVVRAANTGISGAVDPYGRVLAASPIFEEAAFTVDVGLRTERTIYSRTGDGWAHATVLATLALVWLAWRRPDVQGDSQS